MSEDVHMYLKHPDWDMDVEPRPLPAELGAQLLPIEARRLVVSRHKATLAMWGDVIDGEYLDVRSSGAIMTDMSEAPVDLVSVDLVDGEYRLAFRGGYCGEPDGDWQPWSHKFARKLPVKGRGQIEVLLLATVKDLIATITIEPPKEAK